MHVRTLIEDEIHEENIPIYGSLYPGPMIYVSATASILPDQCSELSNTLRSIPSVSVGVVNLEYKGQVLPEKFKEVIINNVFVHFVACC